MQEQGRYACLQNASARYATSLDAAMLSEAIAELEPRWDESGRR